MRSCSFHCSSFVVEIRYLPLKLLQPVPSDIAIASAQQPKDVADLAEEVGLYPDEVNLYGKKKAKVALSVLDRLSHVKDGRYVVVTGTLKMLMVYWTTRWPILSGWGVGLYFNPNSSSKEKELNNVVRIKYRPALCCFAWRTIYQFVKIFN